jgi:hypothetical protein
MPHRVSNEIKGPKERTHPRVLRGRRRHGRIASVILWLSVGVNIVLGEHLPIETFCKSNQLGRMQLSPDGKHLAAIAYERGRAVLLVNDLITGARRRLPDGDFWEFLWANNNRLLCYTGGALQGGLYAVNIDGSQEKLLVQPIANQLVRTRGFQAYALAVLKVVPAWNDSVLVERFTIDDLYSYPHPELRRLNI